MSDRSMRAEHSCLYEGRVAHVRSAPVSHSFDYRVFYAYLDLAEERGKRHIPMAMEDWARRLDAFLEFDEREILRDSGKVTAALAKTFAESEFEKFRIVQDRVFESDFDKVMKKLESKKNGKE